jgi:hypothetical protein
MGFTGGPTVTDMKASGNNLLNMEMALIFSPTVTLTKVNFVRVKLKGAGSTLGKTVHYTLGSF